MIRPAFCLLLLLLCAACSEKDSKQELRKAPICLMADQGISRAIAVRNIYIYGGYHGTLVVDERCPAMARSAGISGEISKASPSTIRRVEAFRRAFYMTPKIRSGVYVFSGTVDIDYAKDLVLIRDVTHFEEVSSDLGDKVLNEVRAARMNRGGV